MVSTARLLPLDRMTAAQRPQKTNESDSRARSTLRSSGETPHARLKTGSQAPRQNDRRHGRRPNHPPLSRPRRERDSAQRNSERQPLASSFSELREQP